MKDTKGRFLPGNSGKPKGAKNKSSESLRRKVHQLLEDNYEQLVTDLQKLDPKSRADLWCKLLEYALPKLNRTEIAEPPTDLEQLMQLTPEERQARIIELQAKLNGKSA